MSVAGWLNWAWMKRCQGELARFHRAAGEVQAEQAQLLQEIIATNGETAFGRHHRFERIRTPRDFQNQVPLADYDDLHPWIDRAARGEQNVLTREPIRLFEPTSGTTSAEKLIPYTVSLQRQFQRGIAAWMGDLFSHRPAVRRGRTYWSISPSFGAPRRSPGGIPIGFDDDAAYLGGLERLALRYLLVTPRAVAQLEDKATIWHATMLCLLAAKDLSLISVWNPSFLNILLDDIDKQVEKLCVDLRKGRIDGKVAIPISCTHRRIEEIIAIYRSTSSASERYRQLWPQLALVSCWADSSAASPFDILRKQLPHAEFQAKGLLATEGFVSLPLCTQHASALAARSHFFEFLPSGEESQVLPRLAHELEAGGRYRVVFTTGGGLYRYQLYDEIEVIGHWKTCPLLHFIGKTNQYCDLVGEKLSEPFVRKAIDKVCSRYNVESAFSLLFPKQGHAPQYCLLLQAQLEADVLQVISADLQNALEQNPYYRHAIDLKQLARLEVTTLNPAKCDAQRLFLDQLATRGQKLGDIKPTALDRWPGWEALFAPYVQARSVVGDHRPQKPPTSPASLP